VKTARFAKVVEKCGKPKVHLALIDPAEDRTMKAAVKEQRAMTIWRESVGTKADRGKIGFEPGPGRQFLIFPKSLRAFAGRTVVGIKYDLLDSREVPKSERATLRRAPTKPKPKPSSKHKREKRASPVPDNVVAFNGKQEEKDVTENVTDLKKKVRRAMAALEEGKAVAAFNLLKQIVED
jgi:hypothetical protein